MVARPAGIVRQSIVLGAQPNPASLGTVRSGKLASIFTLSFTQVEPDNDPGPVYPYLTRALSSGWLNRRLRSTGIGART